MPLFSEHINNMYYSGSPSYSASPYSSYSAPIGSSYSASYLNPGGNYSKHSSLVGYTRPPITSRWNTSSGRNYSPLLTTISERSTSSPLRINSPRRLPYSHRTYGTPTYTPKPININTADIDVSRDKYKIKSSLPSSYVSTNSSVPKTATELPQNDEISVDNESPFMPRVDGQTETDKDAISGTQRSTIRRGRTVVRLHTIKRKERDSPRKAENTTEIEYPEPTEGIQNDDINIGWREKLSDDLVYKDKREKKTLGAKLVEKFIVKDKNDNDVFEKSSPKKREEKEQIPLQANNSDVSSKSPDRRCSVEMLAEQATLLDSLIRRENLSVATLDLTKVGISKESNNILKFQDTKPNSLQTTRSDYSLHTRINNSINDGKDKHYSKRRSLKKSASGGSIRRLDSITELPKELASNSNLPAIEETRNSMKNEAATSKQNRVIKKNKITSSVEVVPPSSPIKFRVDEVTVEEKPRDVKKEICYSSVIDETSDTIKQKKRKEEITDNKSRLSIRRKRKDMDIDAPSPEPDDGNFWSKIGKRETIYLMKRKQNLDREIEESRRAMCWFPEDDTESFLEEVTDRTKQSKDTRLPQPIIMKPAAEDQSSMEVRVAVPMNNCEMKERPTMEFGKNRAEKTNTPTLEVSILKENMSIHTEPVLLKAAEDAAKCESKSKQDEIVIKLPIEPQNDEIIKNINQKTSFSTFIETNNIISVQNDVKFTFYKQEKVEEKLTSSEIKNTVTGIENKFDVSKTETVKTENKKSHEQVIEVVDKAISQQLQLENTEKECLIAENMKENKTEDTDSKEAKQLDKDKTSITTKHSKQLGIKTTTENKNELEADKLKVNIVEDNKSIQEDDIKKKSHSPTEIKKSPVKTFVEDIKSIQKDEALIEIDKKIVDKEKSQPAENIAVCQKKAHNTSIKKKSESPTEIIKSPAKSFVKDIKSIQTDEALIENKKIVDEVKSQPAENITVCYKKAHIVKKKSLSPNETKKSPVETFVKDIKSIQKDESLIEINQKIVDGVKSQPAENIAVCEKKAQIIKKKSQSPTETEKSPVETFVEDIKCIQKDETLVEINKKIVDEVKSEPAENIAVCDKKTHILKKKSQSPTETKKSPVCLALLGSYKNSAKETKSKFENTVLNVESKKKDSKTAAPEVDTGQNKLESQALVIKTNKVVKDQQEFKDTKVQNNKTSEDEIPFVVSKDIENIPDIINEPKSEKENTVEDKKADSIEDKEKLAAVEIKQPSVKSEFKVPAAVKKPVKYEPALRPLIATPRPLQKKTPQIIHSSSSSTSSSEEESSSDEEDADESNASEESGNEFYECENQPDGRTSTGSNDSGFDSSAPTSPAGFVHIKKDCDVNCHRKCEKLTANLCGVNQRLLVEALATRTASKRGGEAAPAASSSAASAPATPVVNEQELETSTAYGIFRKTGRFTPPAKSIPRFRKYNVEDFHFIKVLGKGSFGKVLLAELRDTEYYYAIKCLKKDVVLEDDDVECTLIERKVLALGTNHPYLCHLFATFQTDSHLFFVMEYLNGGDLMFHIQQSGRFPEARSRFYAAEIVSGLKFLHKRGIVYRDLKLDNILLDYEGHVRIADFGMCKLQIFLDKTADTFCGTPDYMAPEIIKGLKYNQTVDWWSFGVLLYEMLIGQSPFSGCDEDELFWSICNEMPSYPRFLSQESLTILTRLLDKDARTRLGGTECMHGDIRDQEFFRAIHWDRLDRRELETPFKPRVKHPLDTQYFDRAFTGERPRLTAVEPQVLRSMDQAPFRGFSYTNPNATDR